MMTQFQAYLDACGDLTCADGTLIDISTGDVFRVGSDTFGGGTMMGEAAQHLREAVEAPIGTGGTFLGGSGRNLICTGLVPVTSGPLTPQGIWQPERPGFWKIGGFVLEVTGPSAATISDAVDVVAELTTGGTAPVGDYDSTTYGADTYNGGTPFTLTVAGEPGTPSAIPAALVTISSGTAQSGTYTATDTANYVSDDDPLWTLLLNADGTAELIHDGTTVAERGTGLGHDPAGLYSSTEAAASYNPVYDDDLDANVDTPWTATVQIRRETSRAGFVFLRVVESGGVVDSVTGPFFEETLPTPASGETILPIGLSDGLGGIEQLVTGPILWSPGRGIARAITWGTVADSTDPATQGEVKMDADYLYGAIATDTWARISWDATPWP